jgi:hypothetical protein
VEHIHTLCRNSVDKGLVKKIERSFGVGISGKYGKHYVTYIHHLLQEYDPKLLELVKQIVEKKLKTWWKQDTDLNFYIKKVE